MAALIRLLIAAALFAIVSNPQAVLAGVASSPAIVASVLTDVFQALVIQWQQQPGLMSVATTCLVLALAAGLFARSLRQRS